jgi:hypothetical protein
MANIQPLKPFELFTDQNGILTKTAYDFLFGIFQRIGGSLDSLNAVTLADKTWESPGTIGSTTANTGRFTNLTTTGTITAGGNNTFNSGSSTFSPNNANIVISPTGTGTFTVNPATTGSFNNVNIGATTPRTGKFTTLEATSGVNISTAGMGLTVKSGANAKIGTATLAAGTVTVSTTAVTANSNIFVSSNADGGTPGWVKVNNVVAGTSFDIVSSDALDTSTVAWMIVERG